MKYSCVTFWVFVMSSCWEKGFSFKWPSRILVLGPTSCGKTTFIKRLLLGNLYLFETRPPRVRYYHGSWRDKFDSMQKHGVEFFEDVPTHDHLEEWSGDQQGAILDDLMSEGGNDKDILNLFTQYSHHLNVTVFYLCRDMFPKKICEDHFEKRPIPRSLQNPRENVVLRTLLT